MTTELIHADVREWLRGHQWMAANGFYPKFHAVFADPPYFLGSIAKRFGGANAAPAKFGKDGLFQRQSRGFLGQQWDGFESPQHYQAWVTEWASMLLDFVYPGGVLAMFGSPRTYHRLAAGLEDAGWEIFDAIACWHHHEGFPKSLNVSKAIDRSLGATGKVVGRAENWGASRLEDGKVVFGDYAGEWAIVEPETGEAIRWKGYGTLLKPAYEPIVLCRAPRGSLTYAECAMQFGSSALNIDGARIGVDERTYRGAGASPNKIVNHSHGDTGVGMLDGSGRDLQFTVQGRYPSNAIFACACEGEGHDASCAVGELDRQTGITNSGRGVIKREGGFARQLEGRSDRPTNIPDGMGYGDEGFASRFYFQPKPAIWEREAGLDDFEPTNVNDGRDMPIDNPFQRGETLRRNTHPTLKPIRLNIQLCQYISTLMLPPQLDVPRRLFVPFAGSGSEMIGAHLAGWDEVVGIEMTDAYIPLNHARVKWWTQFKSYEDAEKAYKREKGIADTERRTGMKQLELFG